MFSDYVFIDEKSISEMSGIELEPLYESLLGLNRARVVHYVPRRTCPSVTFTQKRLDTDRIVITPAIYEERKAKYALRIEAMKEYALSGTQCRSRLLLRYFGERNALPCQQCDNCRAQRGATFPDTLYHAYLDMVSDLLHGEESHPVEALQSLPIPEEHLRPFLTRIVNEERFVLCDGMISRRGEG